MSPLALLMLFLPGFETELHEKEEKVGELTTSQWSAKCNLTETSLKNMEEHLPGFRNSNPMPVVSINPYP